MSRCILLVAMLTTAIQAQNNECNAKYSKQQCIRNNKTPQCQYGHELCCSWCTSTDTLDNLCFGQKSAKKLNTSNWSCDKTSQTETTKSQLDTKLEITSPRALKLLLMFCASFIPWPVTPDLFVFSEPARSIRFIFPQNSFLSFLCLHTVFT